MSSYSAAAAYRANRPGGKASLIEEHYAQVSSIAHHLIVRLPPSVEVDDLIQAGMIALIEAAQSFKEDKGASFATYAHIRIRGAMLDEVRKSDWAPRSVHQQHRAIVAATRKIEAATLRPASPAEIAGEAGMTETEYHKALDDAARAQILSMDADQDDDHWEGSHSPRDARTPAMALQSQAFKSALAEAIGSLPERERLILSLYYEQEMNQREIGSVLDVTESRVSQLLGQATLRLRSRLRDWELSDVLDPED